MSNREINVQEIDKNMIIEDLIDNFKWIMPTESPFKLSGFLWFSQDKCYRRLPKKPMYKLSEEVDILANCTAGGQIRFRTNSSSVAVKVKLLGAANMVHMTATGQCGFDIYAGTDEKVYYCGTTKFDHTKTEYEYTFFKMKDKLWKNIIINFPLYQGVEQIQVGIEASAEVQAPFNYKSDKKILFYGTSITQGGCASRPGMAYTNILSRKLNMEVINLGFSGNGKGEPEMAKLIASIENPACLVLDYEPNCISTDLLGKTLPEFIRIYREVHPKVPILVVSRISYAMDRYDEEISKARTERKAIQKNTVEKYKSMGDSYIYFYDGEALLGQDFEECTVDGIHPTDLGFSRIAEGLERPLLDILNI
ncbi:SGNH/GDSL hydrolase family protein [Clostridium swellfunianum]|uniref:SGNH/GDSL hydrolase family protein n=1 Tax=Clostridium swellfunianum TaxID=1367462 RepID=UPI00203006E0|nr:SGNH/GDSL hydrolase family protein [Clostridium swellfunianum]MCM0649863.1 SGNH/GDSL hydrolase family protein [Clostridium swellfunianum]